MEFNDIFDKVCVKAARVCRIMSKPELRSKIDVECEIYPDEESTDTVAKAKIKCEPKIKLVNIVLGAVAIRATYRLFRELFKD